MTNTRDSERIPTSGQVTGEVTVYEPMTILDLSDRGAQVETQFALHLGSLHEFRLSLGERSVVVKGRIAHCQIGELQEGTILYRSGIEFIEPSEHAAERSGETVDLLDRLIVACEVCDLGRVDRLDLLDQPLERREAPAQHDDVHQQDQDDREREKRELEALIADPKVQVRGSCRGEQRRHDHQHVDGQHLAGKGRLVAGDPHGRNGVWTPYRQKPLAPTLWAHKAFGAEPAPRSP